MDTVAYWRLSGAGNDFLALIEPPDEPSPAEIAAWCRRGSSLGADGVFVIWREPAGHVRMDHYNADGGVAELCVNGTRCAARLAFDLSIASRSVEIETASGMVRAEDRGTAVAVEVPSPQVLPRALALEDLIAPAGQAHFVQVGVPHVVITWPGSLRDAPVGEIGRRVRHDPRVGAAGANVNFVRFASRSRLEVRTYERGVEAETLACGSGILASAAVGWAVGALDRELEVVTAGGFPFAVVGGAETATVGWRLIGDARIVAQGEIFPGALATAAEPEWTP
jgi:diaminopimelate epimerase